MCGICGVIQLSGEPRQVIDPALLDRMTDVMTHRGPAIAARIRRPGSPSESGVSASSTSKVAISRSSNEDETVWAIQNGELYNHPSIRRELESDRHVLEQMRHRDPASPLRAVRSGAPCQVARKFAVAVWDGRRRRALLARDPLGVKPLYFAVAGDLVIFASELKCVLASGLVVPEIDVEAIDAYLMLGYVPAPRSPSLGVAKVPPGHRLIVSDGKVDLESYWQFPQPPAAFEARSEDDWAAELVERLDEAVRLRLMSDVPLGAMLSGGLDSSIVVALMARNMSEPVKTFSVGFTDAGTANELADARAVANAFGTEHHELELSLDDDVVDLADLAWWLDEPLADLSALGFFHISRLAAEHVVVALSGQGADELFGGYLKHRAAALSGRFPRPLAVAAGLGAAHGPKRLRRAGRALLASNPGERLIALSGKLDARARARLVQGRLAALDGGAARRAIDRLAGGLSSDPLAETLFLDAQLALPDDMLQYFDRTSMAHSLEVRVPFLDHEFVQFATRVPSNLKVRRGVGKYILRKAAEDLVPRHVLEKPKQGFFRGSVDLWFERQRDGAISDWLLGPEPCYAEFVDPAQVRELVEAHRTGRDRRSGQLLLAILMLEVWLSSFVQRALRPAPAVTPVAP